LTGEKVKMINELYKLGEAMSSAGILLEEWPIPLEELRKVSPEFPFYKLSISKDYSVYNIEEIADQEFIRKLGKWEPSNGSSFPVFNMPKLFLFSQEQIQRKDDWVSGKEQFDVSLLKSWCTEKTNNWDNKAISKLESCLHTVPQQLKQRIDPENSLDNNSIVELIKLLGKITVEDFRKTLENCIFEKLERQENVKVFLRFLFLSKQSKDVQVILDLYNWKPFGKPVANEETIEWLNNVLVKSEQIELMQLTNTGKQDAFGCEYRELKKKMPKVKLAGTVGDVKLRSMFHEHPCQFRYTLIDDGSYPISMVNRGKVQNALKWLKEPDKEDKTWGMVDSDEILFAYPSVIPQKPLKLAQFLGTSSSNTTPAKFENIAEDLVQTLRGLPPEKKITNIQIFAIRKMDRARSKIVYFRNHNTEQIIKSAEAWKKGFANIPSITFRVGSQKKDSEAKAMPKNIKPEIPKPLHIAKIVNKSWKMDGAPAGELKMVKYYQGLELLLEQNRYDLAVYLLSILLPNTYGLVIYLGNLLHSDGVIPGNKFQPENYLFLPSLIGMLLYSQNRVKEEYMEDIPYLMGQILKISDELHTFYCKVVRDGNVPPQLVGNSLMASALEAPERTLAQLGQRILPYLAWAKQYRTKNCEIKGKESWRAAWYLGLYERNATIFKDKFAVLQNIQFKDREKAELFIGYLADFPKKEETVEQSNS